MGPASFTTLRAAACRVLETPAPADKVAITERAYTAWQDGALTILGDCRPPDQPARLPKPALLPPREMPKRGHGGSRKKRIALLHALAHIELNAIDLAWDLIARFHDDDLPRAFYDDWVRIAAEEADHFALVEQRLAAHGSHYGALPAHAGLWQAARATSDDVLARLAIVPLVLEARGLDVTPDIKQRLAQVGDHASAAALDRIYRDEIGHVASGKRWFDHICEQRGLEIAPTWRALVQARFRGGLKAPFNDQARAAAGLSKDLYEPLAPS